MTKLQCLIIDDDNESVKRLKGLLEKLDDIEVVRSTTAHSVIIGENLPKGIDLVFLAIEMPHKDGFEIIGEFREQGYYPAFIFISPHKQYAIKAIKFNIFDYLLKPIDFNELKETINRYRLLFPDKKQLSIEHCKVCDSLSRREKEVLSYIIKGYTSQEISKLLFISVSTINFHRQNILLKTGAKNFSELSFKLSEGDYSPVHYRLN